MTQIVKPIVGDSEDTWGTDLNNYLDAVKFGISVKEYGAVGDGVTDDTAALNAALAIGVPVFVPVGTYRLTASIAIPNQCILIGAGRPSIDSTSKTIFYCDHDGDGFVITNTGTEQIHLSGFTLTKESSDYTGTDKGIKIYTPGTTAGTGVQIDNVKINYFDTGLYLANTIMDNFEKISIRNCTSYGIHLYGSASDTGPHDCYFKDIWIYTTATGIYFNGYNNQHDFEHIKIMSCSTIPIQTTATVEGLITFNGLMFEINNTAGSTALMNIIGGSHWLFNDIYSAEVTPVFSTTTDTDVASITVRNSRVQNIGNAAGIYLDNVYHESEAYTHKMWSDSIEILDRKYNTLISAPYVRTGSVYGNSVISPATQVGVVQTQYISAAGQDLSNVYWTQSPLASITVTGSQTDPYGGTNAYKLVLVDSNVASGVYAPIAYGGSPAGKDFTFQVWAKPVSVADCTLKVQLNHTETVYKGHTFYLNRNEWTLCSITLKCIAATPTDIYAYIVIPAGNVNGVYVCEPCFYQSEVPLISQNANETYVAGSYIERKFGQQVKYTGETLLSVTTVSLAANADTTIYTVPTGKRCLLTKAYLVAGADASTSDISIGQNLAETDFVGVTNLDNLNAQYDMCLLAPVPSATPATLKSYAAGTVIQAKVANQAGGATNSLYLFGILY